MLWELLKNSFGLFKISLGRLDDPPQKSNMFYKKELGLERLGLKIESSGLRVESLGLRELGA